MAAAVGVRGDYEAAHLRALAKRSDDAGQIRRLLALSSPVSFGAVSGVELEVGSLAARISFALRDKRALRSRRQR